MKICPVLAYDCPYFMDDADGHCSLVDPLSDCDDYYAYVGDEEDAE